MKDYETVNEGVKITWVDVPGAEVAQKYLAAVSANQAPDLANIYEMPRFIELGALADIAPLLPKEDAADFYEGFWKGLTFDGKVSGFPWYTGTGGLVYSRKMMQDAGLNPEQPPDTWEKAIEDSRTIKDKSGKYGLLMTVGQGELVQILQQEGVNMVSEDRKKAALNTPDAVALFGKWREFYKGGYLPPEGTTANPRDSNQWFYAGRGAYVPGGPVVIVRRADPAVLTQWDTDLSGSLRGKNGKAIASLQYLVVSAKSKNVQAAVDLGAYVTSTPMQIEFITQVPILPTRQSVSQDPEFKKNFSDKQASGRDQQALLDRGFKIQLEELQDAITDYNAVPSVVGWARMYDLFKQETNKMFATDQTPEATLTNIEQGWNAILAEKA
jgi:putative chitobiose transport system substrate-binding protein